MVVKIMLDISVDCGINRSERGRVTKLAQVEGR